MQIVYEYIFGKESLSINYKTIIMLKNQIIADNGGTKCTWVLLSNNKKKQIQTKGVSPYILTPQEIETLLTKEVLPFITDKKIDTLHFYSTGLGRASQVHVFKKIFEKVFQKNIQHINMYDDMLAVARAVCQHDKGIVSILGTGTNISFYDGVELKHTRQGLGYALGDEGSGTYLGRKTIQYYYYGIFNASLKKKFQDQFQITKDQLLDTVYKKPLANAFIASFAFFLNNHRGEPLIEEIIYNGLNDFFHYHVKAFDKYKEYPLHFTGGIAHHFSDILKDLCSIYGFKVGQILSTPMDGLIIFHSNESL